MKTDRVLTMHEFLDECFVVQQEVHPPAGDARHIPITADRDVDLDIEAHGRRCDRWGHPCLDCLEPKPQTRTAPAELPLTKQAR